MHGSSGLMDLGTPGTAAGPCDQTKMTVQSWQTEHQEHKNSLKSVGHHKWIPKHILSCEVREETKEPRQSHEIEETTVSPEYVPAIGAKHLVNVSHCLQQC